MPSKVFCDTEDQVMEEVVDIAADVKTLKVRKVSRLARNLIRTVTKAMSIPDRPMFNNMWLKMLSMLTSNSRATCLVQISSCTFIQFHKMLDQ